MNNAITLIRAELLEVQDSIWNAGHMFEVERLTAAVPVVSVSVEVLSGSNKFLFEEQWSVRPLVGGQGGVAGSLRNLFIDRFKELKTRAEVINKHIAALVFMDSFSPEDARFLIRTLGQEEGSSLYDLDYLCSFARGMDIAVGKKGSVAFGSSLTESQDKINEIINNPNDMFSDKISVPSMDSKLDFKCTQYGSKGFQLNQLSRKES
ncbi:hypothetical protein MUCCIDRAFT_109608 [Mucor lusitanicus CBS 277.49]|uniref:Uncharacterized protein n=1 Tax=Mucor lusitanicus CBS 277.49 TaxID=747725 RepID=A0A162QKI3_MUCCL|nr:hypothetical protein MUCCIDRAFT_109608 [Mucor lusitanicus CBS 277.49]